jgi:tyrosyl-tRNA synthetase
MEAKKRLARTIVAGFHSEEAAKAADENWAKQFQKKETPENLEEVSVFVGVTGQNEKWIPGQTISVSLIGILSENGLADSRSDAERKINQGAVRIDSVVYKDRNFTITQPQRVAIRVGKRAKIFNFIP